MDSPWTQSAQSLPRRRHVSTAPVDEKSLRDKYAIMTNMWLPAQMKQPGRSIHRDFDRCTFVDFLETLLEKKHFNLHKEVNGTLLLVPRWTNCVSYEFQIRKEASRLCREEGAGIKAASLWATLANTEHRMLHWLQLVSIANSRSGGGGDYAALERKFNELQREVRDHHDVEEETENQKPCPPQPSRCPLPTYHNRNMCSITKSEQKASCRDSEKTRAHHKARIPAARISMR